MRHRGVHGDEQPTNQRRMVIRMVEGGRVDTDRAELVDCVRKVEPTDNIVRAECRCGQPKLDGHRENAITMTTQRRFVTSSERCGTLHVEPVVNETTTFRRRAGGVRRARWRGRRRPRVS